MGLAGFTLADRLGAKSSPCSVQGCTRTWISIAGGQGRQARRPRRGRPGRSRVVDVRSRAARSSRASRDAQRPCDRARAATEPGPGPPTAQLEAFATKRPGAARAVRRLRGEAGRAGGQAAPLLGPGLHALVGLHQASAAAGRRARRRARAAGAPMCGQCEGVYQQAEGPPGQLRHQRLQAQVDLERRRADPGLRQRPVQRAAPPHVRRVQGRLRRHRRPRGPLPHLGLQEDLDLDARRSARRLRRRQAGAQGAAPDVRELHRHLPGAQGRRASLPPHRLQADLDRQARRASWRARCAARPAIPIPSTARAARRRWASSRIARSPARPRTAPGPGPGPSGQQLAAGVRPEPKPKRSPKSRPTTGRAATPDQTHRREGRREPDGRAGGGCFGDRRRSPRHRRQRRGAGDRRRESGPSRGQAAGKGRTGATARRRREIRPPERRCQSCIDFLKDRKTMEIPCKQLRDAHLLAAREPAADPPRCLGRAVACAARASATRPRPRAPSSARRCAPPSPPPSPAPRTPRPHPRRLPTPRRPRLHPSPRPSRHRRRRPKRTDQAP